MDKLLHLHEKILLLILRDNEGTFATEYTEHLIAGAILAELLLDGYISVEASRKQLVNVGEVKTSGDPLIDACLERMAGAKRRGALKTWISRLAGIKDLKHRVARRLCDQGILRADQRNVPNFPLIWKIFCAGCFRYALESRRWWRSLTRLNAYPLTKKTPKLALP